MRPNLTYPTILEVTGERNPTGNTRRKGVTHQTIEFPLPKKTKRKSRNTKDPKGPECPKPVPRQLVFAQVQTMAHQAPFPNGYQTELESIISSTTSPYRRLLPSIFHILHLLRNLPCPVDHMRREWGSNELATDEAVRLRKESPGYPSSQVGNAPRESPVQSENADKASASTMGGIDFRKSP